ncbi:flavin reductase like domain-containing protein [Zychaea mexicana]|uniref:flavin reductase like domain-containing protein n=1 Tax=Zychaea mexicana TaxID=64656 RepID=UPI0022FE3DF6|nr:flavin reductase like domain-containing protein [Zychaea mexicana]KAI9492347.1 flavin reductase like domain-containing protein [Zychaea mexicana]
MIPTLFTRQSVTLFKRTTTYSLRRTAGLRAYTLDSNGVADEVRQVMRRVPQPVVVVTTSDGRNKQNMNNGDSSSSTIQRRGVTVSSFTPICLHPEPIVSFCVRVPSRASELLHSSGGMIVNVLSHEQVQQSIAFSAPNKTDQFKDIPFYDDPTTGLPVLMGTLGSMHCEVAQVLELGDHELWITKVVKVDHGVGGKHGRREEAEPLLYHDRRYRSVGEQVFMKAFEDSNLDAKLWTHRAHVRMAWNYLRELGKEKATPVIKDAIRRHFEMNPTKHLEYHETITSFYIHLVDLALQTTQLTDEDDFFEFIEQFPALTDRRYIHQYYSPQALKSSDARKHFMLPDLKALPCRLIPDEEKEKE